MIKKALLDRLYDIKHIHTNAIKELESVNAISAVNGVCEHCNHNDGDKYWLEHKRTLEKHQELERVVDVMIDAYIDIQQDDEAV